jgi:predicted membrane protein
MKRKYKGLIYASVLILIGGFLLLKNLNLLPVEIPTYVFTWKMLLVVIGGVFLIRGKWFIGLLLIGIGKYFLLPDIFGIPQPDLESLWPALLIFLGVLVLFKSFFPKKKKKEKEIKETLNNDYMDSTVIFGGGSKKLSSYNFHGGKITAIFGGMEIDMTDCCLSKETNVIDVTLIMGGVSLKVPKEWNVLMQVTPIMGGAEDDINTMPDAYVDPAAVLIIKGIAIMGGLEIKRV